MEKKLEQTPAASVFISEDGKLIVRCVDPAWVNFVYRAVDKAIEESLKTEGR